MFILSLDVEHLDILSFPTRRSSDLSFRGAPGRKGMRSARPCSRLRSRRCSSACCWLWGLAWSADWSLARSEEHTTELQSQFHLVCRLMLEKKKRTRTI